MARSGLIEGVGGGKDDTGTFNEGKGRLRKIFKSHKMNILSFVWYKGPNGFLFDFPCN